MVKIYTNQNGQLFKVACLSTDDKPIGVVPANTICEELDTGDKYFYDPVASQWVAYPGGSPTPGGGLPDPSELPDGTAMVAVNGEWKMQRGYGYMGDPAFEPIEWDGDTEGRESINFMGAYTYYKVSDDVLTEDMLQNAISKIVLADGSVEGSPQVASMGGVVSGAFFGSDTGFMSAVAGTYDLGGGASIVFPSDGTYIATLPENVLSVSLTAPSISHSIDHTLMPEGYGYYDEPAFEPITWDGETEGRESINEGTYFKVAEELDITALEGSVATFTVGSQAMNFPFLSVEEVLTNYYVAYYSGGDTAAIILTDDVDTGEGIFHKGVYFPYEEGYFMSALTPRSSAHQFDPALIPSSGGDEFVVTFTHSPTGILADKTLEEIEQALYSTKTLKGRYVFSGRVYNELTFSGEEFQSTHINTETNSMYIFEIYLVDDDTWGIRENSYTLTPVT